MKSLTDAGIIAALEQRPIYFALQVQGKDFHTAFRAIKRVYRNTSHGKTHQSNYTNGPPGHEQPTHQAVRATNP